MRSWYSLLLLTSREAADAVVGLHAQLDLQRPHEGAEHVEQHALAAVSITCRISMLTSVVKTIGLRPSTSAVWLIWRTAWCALSTRVDEGQAHVARLDLELRQDGVAEGFGGDAGAVGDEEDGACVHGVALVQCGALRSGRRAYNRGNYPNSPRACPATSPLEQTTKPLAGCTRAAPERRPGFNFWSFPMSALFERDRPGRTV